VRRDIAFQQAVEGPLHVAAVGLVQNAQFPSIISHDPKAAKTKRSNQMQQHKQYNVAFRRSE
jgi:hypothetical protein